MINPERVTVTSRETSKRSVAPARSITPPGDISRHFRFHSPFFNSERLWDFIQRERERGRRQRRKQRAFAGELISIGLPWILSALTSRRRIPFHGLRAATCKVTTLSSYNELPANEQLSLNAKVMLLEGNSLLNFPPFFHLFFFRFSSRTSFTFFFSISSSTMLDDDDPGGERRVKRTVVQFTREAKKKTKKKKKENVLWPVDRAK